MVLPSQFNTKMSQKDFICSLKEPQSALLYRNNVFLQGCFVNFGLVSTTQLTILWSERLVIMLTESTSVEFVARNKLSIFSLVVGTFAICESELSFNISMKSSYSLGKLQSGFMMGTSLSFHFSLG